VHRLGSLYPLQCACGTAPAWEISSPYESPDPKDRIILRAMTDSNLAAWPETWRRGFAKVFSTQRCIPLTLGLVLLILFVRKTELFLNPQFWAEDTSIFFSQARDEGLSAVFRSYGGYLNIIPRLIAAAGSGLPALYAPALYLFASVVFTLASALAVFSPRLNLACRPLLALALVLVPHNGEVFLTITNIQWVLAPNLLLLLIARDPSNPRQWVFDLVALALLGLTGPFLMLWFPLFLMRAWIKRSRASLILAAVAVLVVSVQFHAYIKDRPAPENGTFLIEQLFRLSGTRFWGPIVMPDSWAQQLGVLSGTLLSIVAFTGVIWLLISRFRHRAEPLFFLVAAGLVLASTFYKFHGNLALLNDPHNGDRYFYIPHVTLLWILIIESSGSGARRLVCLGVLALCALSSASTFRSPPMVDYHWADWAPRIDGGENVTVPVNPPGWCVQFNRQQPPTSPSPIE
jgi:hypothetical protein